MLRPKSLLFLFTLTAFAFVNRVEAQLHITIGGPGTFDTFDSVNVGQKICKDVILTNSIGDVVKVTALPFTGGAGFTFAPRDSTHFDLYSGESRTIGTLCFTGSPDAVNSNTSVAAYYNYNNNHNGGAIGVVVYAHTHVVGLEVTSSKAESARHLNIYPNPAQSEVHLRVDGFDHCQLALYNSLGTIVKLVEEPNELTIRDLAPGLYFARLTGRTGHADIGEEQKIVVGR